MSILSRLFRVNTTTLKVKEAIGFNPVNVGLIEGNGVTYGLSYQDNGNGSSRVKLLISPLYQSKTYECDTGVNVANEFKGQLSSALIENSAEVDKVGVIFPTEETNKERKCIKGLTFNTYEIKHSTNAPLVEHSGKVKLYKNINRDSPANEDNNYFLPKAVKVGNGNVVVVAHNLKDKALVSWYLESKGNGKFKVLREKNGLTERKLFKFDNPGQLVLDENTMLYTQIKPIKNQEVRTNIFKFDMAKVVEDLKSGKKDECLLSKRCQIDNKALSLSREYEISFLQYVKQTEGDDQIAFLAKKQSSNTQELHLARLAKRGPKSNFTVCECEDPIEQLYVKDNGQGGFIVTAVSGESIITFNRESSGKSSEATIIPTSSIKALSDFVNIINGQLMPSIISSSTVAPITVTETVVTSKKTTTAAITSTTETDTVKTTKLTTEASTIIVPTSTMSKSSTESTTQASTVTVGPTTVASTTTAPTSTTSKPSTESTIQTSTVTAGQTTVAKTTTTPQATTVATTSTSAPIVTSETETSTVKSTAATVESTFTASSTTMSKPLTELTTKISTASESTTVAETIATSQATMITTMLTNVPTTNSEATIQTVSTISNTGTKITTPLFTTTLLPQTTPSPQPTQLAIGYDRAGMIGGSLGGAIGIAGIIGFIAYKCIKKYHGYYNTTHMLELADLESHSNGSDEEIFIASNRMSHMSMQTMDQSETVLNSISVESSSRSRSSSSSSSGGPGS